MADEKQSLTAWRNAWRNFFVLAAMPFCFFPFLLLTLAPIGWYWPILIGIAVLSVPGALDVFSEKPKALVLACILLAAGALAMLTRHATEYRETPTGRHLKIESDKWRSKKKVRFISKDEYVQATTEDGDDNDPRY